MQKDINTKGHTQWFYFKTNNKFKGKKIFHILNFYKPGSNFNEGMKMVVWSKTNFLRKKHSWHRAGSKISYYQNNFFIN